jgi:hypothetical protein
MKEEKRKLKVREKALAHLNNGGVNEENDIGP